MLGYGFIFFYWLAVLLLFLLLSVGAYDLQQLFRNQNPFLVARKVEKVLSLSDDNKVQISVENTSSQGFLIEIIDEIPVQFQKRDLSFKLAISPSEKKELTYALCPTERGEYQFGNLILYIRQQSKLSFLSRRITYPFEKTIAVYPSIRQMKQAALLTNQTLIHQSGIKKMRRVGNQNEFDHIKAYTVGDDTRTINWKASGRRAELMVNKYEEERSQSVYCIMDVGRNMFTPFDGMSLVDYSVNSVLSISNMVLKKHDKPGLISFSNKIHTFLPANNRNRQMAMMLESLYRIKATDYEVNYEALYKLIQQQVKQRSLLILFTNFESRHSLEMNLDVLRKINKKHLLVVVSFIDKEMEKLGMSNFESMEDLFFQTAISKAITEKKKIMLTLRKYGINTILTSPKDLNINVINKYLGLKSRGTI